MSLTFDRLFGHALVFLGVLLAGGTLAFVGFTRTVNPFVPLAFLFALFTLYVGVRLTR